MRHEQGHGLFPGRPHHRLGFRELNGDGLFHQRGLAGLQAFHHHFEMSIGRQADIDQINLRVGDQLSVIGVLADIAEIDMATRGAEVALDRRPVPSQLSRVSGCHRGDSCVGQITRTLEMCVSHEADTNDSDSDHTVCIL